MACVVLYFQVHQPYRLRRYSVFDTDRHYFDETQNALVLRQVAQKSYIPANKVLLETIRAHGSRFRVAFSVTGVALEQFEAYAPEVIDGFKELNATGCIEFLDETYYHSLAFLYSHDEFRAQVERHRQIIHRLFNQQPRVFRNTELIYNNEVAQFIGNMGYDAILTEGSDHVLGSRSPNFVYRPPHGNVKILLKNYRISDDIALRFSDHDWSQWPLTADKFARWIDQIGENGHLCNIFIDYETFGERHWADSGIFEFLRYLPTKVLESRGKHEFLTPSEAAAKFEPVDVLDVPHLISRYDSDTDLSTWLGNAMQTNALQELFKLETALRDNDDPELLADWRRLSSSDHFYYMCTKYWTNGTRQNKYFSPYESPYDSYINFMNVLDNVQSRIGVRMPGG